MSKQQAQAETTIEISIGDGDVRIYRAGDIIEGKHAQEAVQMGSAHWVTPLAVTRTKAKRKRKKAASRKALDDIPTG